ncbi:hypothetical protein HHK36_018643 [Tetracentron sinense]|uniref:Pentatricopeptide repeat-containing protein n=1 Tax=Tetracentron sinense TaxID=13715 RepID=A0A834Z0I3_TETSI|nr:hypothetical protein HHK36_018643 [Tetracentron sinense]
MAVSFSLKLDVSPPSLKCQTSNLIPNNRTRNWTLTLPPATIQTSHGGVRCNISEPFSISETDQQSQVQTLADLLRGSAAKGWIKEGKAIHGFVSKSNFDDDKSVVLYNHLAHLYSKCADFTSARRVFDLMSHRNVFSWTIMIVGSTDNGFFFDGFRFFCEMQGHGISPDAFAYSAIIRSCIGLDCGELGEMVHAQIVKTGFSAHVVVSTSLLNMYAKLGQIEDAVHVFNTMTEHNDVSWNAMISGFTSNGLHLEAFNQFILMKKEGFFPNMNTFTSVLKAVGMLGDVGKGREVHHYVTELNIESNALVGTALIDMYSKCGYLSEARFVFDMNFTNCGVNGPWNAMISGYSQGGCGEEALELFIQMCINDMESDLYTYCSVFNAISALKCLQFGRQVHGIVVKSGYDMRILSVNNAIIDAYVKCGSLEDAKKIFKKMEERDVVSWTTLATDHEALNMFSQMRDEGFTPNQFTFASVLVGCSSLCLLEYGRQIHGLLCKARLDSEVCIESALIDMYAKCGDIIEGEKVFKRIVNPDVVSWTAIISGYAQHGCTNKALHLFRRMEKSGIKANTVTLLCVLFACSHGGMVEEGLRYFRLMEERYGVLPEMEHYACIVDLLGRVGCLDDAMEFINVMPIEPTEMVWQTLLGACRVHGNIELGERAAKQIFSIRPEYSATYVLLSNTYIEKGSFEDGFGLRKVMKERGVKKEPGYSWITVKNRVHKFYAGDQNHPKKNGIYAKLEELSKKTKTMGYVPDLSYVLQDM